MTNADKFKNIFGLYATELWSMPEKDFLKWLNSKVVSCSEIPNSSDAISRQQAFDALHCRFADGFEEDRWWNSTHVIATLKGLPAVQSEQVAMIKEIRKWINSKNRGNADYFIVDKIEEIINKYE